MSETPFLPPRYDSNEWLGPIAARAKPIFADFPREEATEIAAAVLQGVDAGTTDIPWVTVFPSDNIDVVGTRLLTTLRTPDYRTPAYDPELHLAVESTRAIIDASGATGFMRPHAAYHLVQTAAGKPDENFRVYQDKARRWPQYADDWNKVLTEQFGPQGFAQAKDNQPELFELLDQSEALADAYFQDHGRLQQEGESTGAFIERAIALFDISSVEGLREASRILGRGQEGYRKASYRLRGLPDPKVK
jgi:hypothetical protein